MADLILFLWKQLGKGALKSVWNKEGVVTEAVFSYRGIDDMTLALASGHQRRSVRKNHGDNRYKLRSSLFICLLYTSDAADE